MSGNIFASLGCVRKPGERIIECLRRLYPDGGEWSYPCPGMDRWERADGRAVQAYSVLTPAYDGDDDNFTSEYRWEDTQERLRL